MSVRLALPRVVRPVLDGLPEDVEAVWYEDGSDCTQAVPGAEILWLNMWRTAEIEAALQAGQQLRWVSYHGAGVDSFPLDLFQDRDLLLTNGRGLQATQIAEYVVMAMLAAAKGLPALVHAQARAEWLAQRPAAVDVAGSRALIIGYGNIGRRISTRLRALEVDVTGVRRQPGAEEPAVIGPDSWRPQLGAFDWVVLCAPLTSQTRHLIGWAELSAMKHSAWVLNVARGSMIDSAALQRALGNQQIGGAYLDLTDPEPLPSESPLWHMPNVIITPHSSGSSSGSHHRAAALFLDNLARYRKGHALRNLVDLSEGY